MANKYYVAIYNEAEKKVKIRVNTSVNRDVLKKEFNEETDKVYKLKGVNVEDAFTAFKKHMGTEDITLDKTRDVAEQPTVQEWTL